MLVAQLLPFSKNLSGRKWTDEDIVEDIQFLRDELSARFESLTYVLFLAVTNNELLIVHSIAPTTSTVPSCCRVTSRGHQCMSPICSGRRTRQS